MTSRAANLVEKAIGHQEGAITIQDVSNPGFKEEWSGEGTMKALVWQGKNKVEVVDVPKPKILEDTDVIIKVTGSTVCGSDLHLLHGVVPQLQKGDILGHEFCGKVDSVGSKITNLKPGQRVVASFQIACGSCWYCERSLSSQCSKTNVNSMQKGLWGSNTAGMFGYSHLTGGFAGGQAEYVRCPLGNVNLLPLPDNVPDEKGLYLSDVLATSWHAVVDTGVEKDDIVAIWGAGPIGQMAAAFSAKQGAKRIIVIDKVQWRLEKIQNTLGKDKVEIINFSTLPKGESVVSTLKKMNDDRGPDVAIECAAGEYPKGYMHAIELATGAETDTSELINEMIEGVRNFGRCGVTGIYAGFTNHFNIGSLMERGIRLIGNGQAPVHLYWKDLLSKIEKDEIDVLQMLSHRIDLADIDKAYYKFENKEDEMQKIFVQTQFSDPPCAGCPELTRL